jgi:hypothetical protein
MYTHKYIHIYYVALFHVLRVSSDGLHRHMYLHVHMCARISVCVYVCVIIYVCVRIYDMH